MYSSSDFTQSEIRQANKPCQLGICLKQCCTCHVTYLSISSTMQHSLGFASTQLQVHYLHEHQHHLLRLVHIPKFCTALLLNITVVEALFVCNLVLLENLMPNHLTQVCFLTSRVFFCQNDDTAFGGLRQSLHSNTIKNDQHWLQCSASAFLSVISYPLQFTNKLFDYLLLIDQCSFYHLHICIDMTIPFLDLLARSRCPF